MKIPAEVFFTFFFGSGFLLVLAGMIILTRVVRFHFERRGKRLPPGWMMFAHSEMSEMMKIGFPEVKEAGYGPHYKVMWAVFVTFAALAALAIFGGFIDDPPRVK